MSTEETRMSQEDIVARLQASAWNDKHPAYRAGYDAGQRWAEQEAAREELERLEAWAETLRTAEPNGWERFFFGREAIRDRNWSPAASFIWTIRQDTDRNVERARQFWAPIRAEIRLETKLREDDDHFVKGFAEGALAAWREVKGQF